MRVTIFSTFHKSIFRLNIKKRARAITKGDGYLYKTQADFLRMAAFQIRSAFLYGIKYIKK